MAPRERGRGPKPVKGREADCARAANAAVGKGPRVQDKPKREARLRAVLEISILGKVGEVRVKWVPAPALAQLDKLPVANSISTLVEAEGVGEVRAGKLAEAK